MEGKEELKEKIIGRINCIKSRFPNEKLNLVEEQINSKFSHLLSNEANEWWSAEVSSAAELAQYIDHTILKADATSDDVTTLCEQAKDFGFKAVCVNGSRSQFAKTLLSNSEVKVAAVVGFPLGASSSKTKQSECEEQINDFQVHEIDVVINIGDLKDANYEKIYLEISALSLICHPRAVLKVILECGALTKEEIIDASILAILADADYIKTSTGFGNYGGAVIEDVKVMRMIAGPNKHVKASGGIRSAKSALDFIHAGADRIGTSSGPLIISQFKEIVSQ